MERCYGKKNDAKNLIKGVELNEKVQTNHN